VTLSARAKLAIALFGLLAAAVFLVVVDFGINAGRIHHGVTVRGIEVGGMTVQEATALLTSENEELEDSPVVLTREGFSCNFIPSELGWDGRPEATAIAAYRVGRGKSWFGALGARVKAWWSGATIDWNDAIDRQAVSQLIDDCQVQAEALGYELRRWSLRHRIHEAIKLWPRAPVNIPVEGRAGA
jgi:hypothetical protein